MRNGNRRLGVLILALSLLIFGCQLPWTVPQRPKVTPTATPTATPERFDPPRIGRIRAEEAVVYEKPDPESRELLRLANGAAVVVLARLGNWAEIALPGTEAGSGWVLLETLVITTEPAGGPLAGQPAAFATAIVVTGATSLRSGPGTVYPAVLAVGRGQALGVIGQIDGCLWVKVIAEERVSGWLPGSFVRLDQPCELFPALAAPPTPRPTRPTSTPTLRPRPPAAAATWTPTPTRRPTRTPTATSAVPATATATPTVTATAASTGTLTATPTATSLVTNTATSTPSPTATEVTPTDTPTSPSSPLNTPTATDTPTTAPPTATPTETQASAAPSATATPTATEAAAAPPATATPTMAAPTDTPTAQPAATATPTTVQPTDTPTAGAATATPTPA